MPLGDGDRGTDTLILSALSDYGVHLSKWDKQDLATEIVDSARVTWLMEFLGLSVAPQSTIKQSLRQEVADAYVLLSGDVRDFRRSMIEHAVQAVLFHATSLDRPTLVANTLAELDIADSQAVESAVDRLIQSQCISKANGAKLALHEDKRKQYSELRTLVATAIIAYRKDMELMLSKYLPGASKRRLSDACEMIETQVGKIAQFYNEYQAAILSLSSDAEDIRARYRQELGSVRAMIHQAGIAEDKISECIQGISELEKTHPVVTRLGAGEVFRRLTRTKSTTLMSALGRSTGIDAYLESTVAIPLLCTKLFTPIKSTRGHDSAAWFYQQAANVEVNLLLPDIYLEESSFHLILAGRYPAHVAAEWLGHSTMVAQKHYWRTTDADFEKAAAQPAEAVHEAVQSASVSGSHEKSEEAEDSEKYENFEKSDVLVGSRVDSNHRLSACKAAALAAEPRDRISGGLSSRSFNMCEPLTADFVTLLHAYAGAKACHPTRQRRLRESNPRPLRAAVFKTVSSTNRTVSFALSIKQRRPESNGLLLVQSESCAPLHYAATNSRRSKQAPAESNGV